MAVTPADLSTYLGNEVDPGRAKQLIDMATRLCKSVVSPLPDDADVVILDVVARAYTNPTNATSQNAGPFAANFGAVAGGLWLTRQNKSVLRGLAGTGGGVFTIDTAPADAESHLPWWARNNLGYTGFTVEGL